MTSPKTRKSDLPAPFYAAAGASEVAYQQIRRLPDVAVRTLRTAGETAESLRDRVRSTDTDLTGRLQQVRESTQKGVNTLAAQALAAQERAILGYRHLVVRGEQMVNDRLGVTTGHTESGARKVEVTVGEPERGPSASSSKGSSPTASGGGRAGAGTSSAASSPAPGSGSPGSGSAGATASGATASGSTASGATASGATASGSTASGSAESSTRGSGSSRSGMTGQNNRGVGKTGTKTGVKRSDA